MAVAAEQLGLTPRDLLNLLDSGLTVVQLCVTRSSWQDSWKLLGTHLRIRREKSIAE
jgi:hypothetical protein